MSQRRSIKVAAILRALRSAGIQYRKVYIFAKEIQILALDKAGESITLVWRV
jgi:hypothetical protein